MGHTCGAIFARFTASLASEASACVRFIVLLAAALIKKMHCGIMQCGDVEIGLQRHQRHEAGERGWGLGGIAPVCTAGWLPNGSLLPPLPLTTCNIRMP